MTAASRLHRLLALAIDAAAIGLTAGVALLEAAPEPLRALGAVLFVALSAADFIWLVRRGQTLGKKIVGLRIVRRGTTDNGGFTLNILKRCLLPALIYLALILIPYVGVVFGALFIWADALFIFRKDRLCLHDRIAGTEVIAAAPAVVQ